jgi:hypothetical protein
MIKGIVYTITLIMLAGCFGEEGGNSAGGGLFVNHKPVENSLSISAPSNGMYNESDVLSFSATHPYNMTVIGTPRLVLNIGGSTVYADYVSGDGSKTINFEYTIQAGDNDADGISISTLELNGGTITFSKGDVNLTLPGLNTSGVIVSTTPAVEITNPSDLSIINIANNTTTYAVSGTCNQTGVTVALTINSGAVTGTSGLVCDGANFSGSFDISAQTDGALALEADLLGATSSTINLTKDTIAPALVITSSPDIDGLNVTNYAISGTCDENTATVNIAVGTLSNTATCNGATWSVTGWDMSSLGDNASIAVDVDYVDAALNPASDSTSIAKTTSAYSVTLNALTAINIANEATYVISGTCSHDTETVSLDIGGGTITDSQACASGTFSFNVDTATVTDNTSIAIQVDHGGASDSTNVLKDTVAPTLAITLAVDIDSSNVANYGISGVCSEDGTINIDLGGLTNTATCSGGGWSLSGWDVSGLSDATGIVLTADQTDAAGNAATQATDTVDKDVSVYTVAITTADTINIANLATYVVSGTCSTDTEDVNLDIGGATVTDTVTCTGGAFSFSVDVNTVGDNASVAVAVDHGTASDSTNVLKDTSAPTLDSNSITATTYSLGNTISIDVNFSEAVIVSGNPRIELSFESQSTSPIYATLASGNLTSTLTFEYTIASGDNDANGIDLAASIDLNSGSIEDAGGNSAATTLATTNFAGVLVDSAAPYITSFVEPADGTYADGGGELLFQVNFSESVTVSGNPRISINLGGSTVYATYQTGSGTAGLEFSYAIQAGDNDGDGITLNSTSIDLNSGTINATADSDPSALEFGTYLDSLTGVLVDTSGAITAPNQVTGVTTAPTTSNTELSVAWSVPNDNGTAIIDYSVQYREQGTSTWNNVNPSPITNTTTVNGLSSGVTYEIRVAANNGLLGAYSAISTAEIFDVLSLNPVAWLSSTNITNGGSEPLNNDKVDQWEDLTGAASAATEADPARQPTYQTNVQNGLPAVRFDNLDRGLQGTFTRSIGTNLTFIIVGQFDTGSTDKCLFEFAGPGNARGFFIDRRYASNNNYSPALTKGSFQLWRIEDSGGNASVTEGGSTQLYSGGTSFNTDFTGTGNYVLGDDITGGNRMNGFIGEFLIFDRALTPTEINTLETYLINKWGL